jgi:ankyrin repeat protein
MSGGDWKAMFQAIEQNDFELVKYYLKIGVDPNYQHPEFLALPLSECIRYNNIELVGLLIQYGAKWDINEMESGLTSKQLAEKENNKKIIELLKD